MMAPTGRVDEERDDESGAAVLSVSGPALDVVGGEGVGGTGVGAGVGGAGVGTAPTAAQTVVTVGAWEMAETDQVDTVGFGVEVEGEGVPTVIEEVTSDTEGVTDWHAVQLAMAPVSSSLASRKSLLVPAPVA